MFRSVNTTLMNGLGNFLNINKEDFELERPKTEEDKNDPDFEKKAKKRVEERIRKIIESINGAEYNYDDFDRKMVDKKFFGNGFTLNINSGIQTKEEAEEVEKERQKQLQEQQKNDYLKQKEKNNCFSNCCCCCSGNSNKDKKDLHSNKFDKSESSERKTCCCC